jgi:Predicted xylanase/chitin deacetylase
MIGNTSLPGLAKQTLKWTANAVDRVRHPPRGIVVLIYHRVGARSSLDVDLPLDRFEAQMETLGSTRRVLSLDDALDRLDAPPETAPDDDPIVITFDDGTADFAELALPVLVRLGLPATLYLATEFIDEGRDFPNQGPPLSWSALQDVRATDLVTIGSHTHTHALLDRLPPAGIDAELDRADDLIEINLGIRPRHFAYPKAVAGSSPADAAVRHRYRSAALSGTRPNEYQATDPYRLARTPIQCSDGMRFFTAKTHGGMRFEDSLRVAANRWRYRDATG